MSTATHTDRRVVTVTVPATTANLGPGFDCLGLALDLRNTLTLTASEPFAIAGEPEYTITITGVDAAKVPTDRGNLALEAAETVFRLVGRWPRTAELRVHNCIPVGSGLGSSSSAIVGGLVAANALVGGLLSDEALLQLAVDMEGHPDNVAPALLGGLVLGVLPDAAGGPEQLVVRRMEPPRLTAVVVMPDFHFLTAEARAVLPQQVTRADVIFNASRLGLLLHALLTGDFDCLRVAMGDRLHQTQRLGIIPGAAAAFDAAYTAGALGVALSGAGPSLLAFTDGDGSPIATAMLDAFAAAGQNGRSWLLQPTAEGATLAVS